ncbi:MAG: hypothetical protein Q7S51_07510 [Gallionellaceae bacterium]|nr:hypothetical protein [Gallionellaceae bacterium]
MANSPITEARKRPRRFLLLNLRLVAKIALVVGILALVGMVLVFVLITGKSGDSYGAISRSYSLSQQNLAPTLLIAGLFMVALSGFITWLSVLYTSHHIAGPLHAFARNFEALIKHGAAIPVAIRSKDQLKQEEQNLQRSVAQLQQHYGEIRKAAETALAQLDTHPAAAISKLKELDRATQL